MGGSVPMPAEVDVSMPMGKLMRMGTFGNHEVANASQGAQWLTKGELDEDEYVRVLMMYYQIYTALEDALDRHQHNPTLAPTYNPALLRRSPSIAVDIAFFLEAPDTSWQSHPDYQSFLSSQPAALTAYVGRIKELSDSADPAPLLAHSYVRYMGDLSGGQQIKRGVIKSYALESELGRGTKLYDFKELDSQNQADTGHILKIKQWFRDGMEEGASKDPAKKLVILEEAKRVFSLNMDLFKTFKPPSAPRIIASEETYNPLQTEPAKTDERTYSLSTVISVVLAASLTHFLLVIGGFTGSAGYAKLEAFREWITSLLGSPSA